MKKVYSNPKLPYKQDAKFDFPEGYRPCEGAEYTSYTTTEVVEEEPEVVEGAFD